MTAANAVRPGRVPIPDPELVKGIRRASHASGVDFGYLMAQAAQESGFRPNARARTSSASGLYQFVDATWLDLVRRHGARHGLDPEAPRAELLARRDDPALSAAMAAEYARDNKSALENALGRTAGRAELALAHFLGAGGATRFLEGFERNAEAEAAELLPEAAAANRAVFFDRDGTPKTIGAIWAKFSERIDREAATWASLANPPSETAQDNPSWPGVSRPSTSAVSGVDDRAKPGDGERAREAAIYRAPRLSRPTLAMLDAIAFAALKLLGQPPSRS